MTADYPRFSAAEMERRHAAIASAMAAEEVDHLLVYGANRFGLAVGWLTRWPVTREAFVIVTPGEPDTLFVDFYNHIPNARGIATEADVRAAEGRAIELPLAELRRRGAAGRRIGVIGPLPWRHAAPLADFAGELVGMDADFTRLRLVKSPEELDWLRIGCSLTDRAVEALRAGARPGVDERELGALVEAAYLGRGGTTHIHYFSATPMDSPGTAVPAQWPSTRPLAAGDALVCEISASWWDHPGQVLRTFTIEADPTPLYRELHDVADAAFDAVRPAAGGRDGGGARRRVGRDRGRRLHDPRRPRARLRRRLPAAGARDSQPGARRGAGLHLRGGHDGGRAAERRHARRDRRRSDRRAAAGHRERRRPAARGAARAAPCGIALGGPRALAGRVCSWIAGEQRLTPNLPGMHGSPRISVPARRIPRRP
jgi:Xaa-Pro aminopeptidase